MRNYIVKDTRHNVRKQFRWLVVAESEGQAKEIIANREYGHSSIRLFNLEAEEVESERSGIAAEWYKKNW